jgi:hypothetical protein
MKFTWLSTFHRAFAAVMLLYMVGCSDVPRSYRVDTGVYPEYQDDEVRFRTTYYLRVFDLCPVDKDPGAYGKRMGILAARDSGKLELVKDSLLRFRMTGQASALFSNLHFESGVLGADEIDPFGKTVDYNETKKKFEAFNGALQPHGAARAEGGPTSEKCPNGEPLSRRFYLLGPEGIRELDPNERLIMAMYMNAKPLINSLKHLAGQRANKDAEALLPFDLELSKARADSALSVLREAETNATEPGKALSPKEMGDRLLPLFGKEGIR